MKKKSADSELKRVRELAEIIMQKQNLHMLANAEEARNLFIDLFSAIEDFELAGNCLKFKLEQ